MSTSSTVPDCPTCDGRGYVSEIQYGSTGITMDHGPMTCPTCLGIGFFSATTIERRTARVLQRHAEYIKSQFDRF